MTKDDVIRMAREAGILWLDSINTIATEKNELERFAALVAAHEREECAKVCKDKAGTDGYDSSTAVYLSEDIRARGNQ